MEKESSEIYFYQDLFDPESNNKKENKFHQKYVNKYYGITKLKYENKIFKYCVIENMAHTRPHASIIDFKIGQMTW